MADFSSDFERKIKKNRFLKASLDCDFNAKLRNFIIVIRFCLIPQKKGAENAEALCCFRREINLVRG